jgi:hypothetical protein
MDTHRHYEGREVWPPKPQVEGGFGVRVAGEPGVTAGGATDVIPALQAGAVGSSPIVSTTKCLLSKCEPGGDFSATGIDRFIRRRGSH